MLNTGKRLVDLVHIDDPITRGLAVGSAAQGLKLSSMVDKADTFPFAAMAINGSLESYKDPCFVCFYFNYFIY